MIEVFKVFYPTHYNFAAVSILLVLLLEYSFSVHKSWKITDDKGKEHHWCWVEN